MKPNVLVKQFALLSNLFIFSLLQDLFSSVLYFFVYYVYIEMYLALLLWNGQEILGRNQPFLLHLQNT